MCGAKGAKPSAVALQRPLFSEKAATIFCNVLQFLVLAVTPNSFSTQLFGKPNQPVRLRRATIKTARSWMATTLNFSVFDSSDGMARMLGARNRTENSITSPRLVRLKGLLFTIA